MAGLVVLGADITEPGEFLAVGAGENVTLDLAGHDLVVSGVPTGHAAIGVPAGTELVVKDTSGGGEVTATGGAGGAGIGGDAGTAGVSTFSRDSTAQGGAAGANGTVTGGNGLPGTGGSATGQRGGTGGAGGSVAGTAPLATGGEGARGVPALRKPTAAPAVPGALLPPRVPAAWPLVARAALAARGDSRVRAATEALVVPGPVPAVPGRAARAVTAVSAVLVPAVVPAAPRVR